MPDVVTDSARQPRLVNYYDDFAPKRFKNAKGEPVKRRSQQIIAKRLNLPLFRDLIDEIRGDQIIAEWAERRRSNRAPDPARRGPGRPRTGSR